MEKYKLLSSVDPTKFPVVVKKKFSKLTLGNRSSNHQVSSMSKFTQRISYPPEEIDNEHKSFFLTDEGETDKYTLPDSPNGVHCSGLDSQISRQGNMSHENPEKESKDYIGYVKKIESGLRDLGIPSHKSFNTQNMPSLNISGNDCLSQELRKQIRASESDASILTISSTSSNEIDLNHKKITQSDCSKTPEVIILDESSENELPLKESFPAVSESTEKSLNSTIQQKLNAFFDKIPTQSEISLHYKSDNLLAENTFENTKENSMSYDDPVSPVSLNETDNDEIKSGHEKYIPRDIEQKSQVVNISAKIKINIEIEEHEITSSFDESDHQYNDKNEEDDVPIVKKPIIEQKNQGKDDLGIDLEPEVQSILTEMYGDSWKTREVLNSIKKQKRRDPNDTITSKSFGNLGNTLELTGHEKQDKKNEIQQKKPLIKKITETKESQQQNIAKLRNKNFRICDSDSESELEDLESYKSWHISSSENSYSSDSCSNEKRKKHKGFAKKVNRKIESDFVQDASSDSDNTIFENKSLIPISTTVNEKEIEYAVTPQNKILHNVENPGPSTKRKLFSKKLYSNINSDTQLNVDEDLLSSKNSPKLSNIKLEAIKGAIPSKGRNELEMHEFTNSSNKALQFFSQRDNKNYYGFLISLNASTLNDLSHPEALRFRKNFRVMKEELTAVLYNLYNEKIFNNQLNVSIKWNKKLLTTAGRCTNMLRNGVRLAEIDLSEKVLTSADRLRCTLIHELCHAAAWILDSEKKGHAEHWKKWARRANEVFSELPKITVCHHYNIEYKYTYQCDGCGAKTQMHSKTKKVENIQCKYCKGTIRVFINKRKKDGQVVQTPVKAASGFAKFVQQKYKIYKTPQITHAETMKILSQEFTKMNLDKNQDKS